MLARVPFEAEERDPDAAGPAPLRVLVAGDACRDADPGAVLEREVEVEELPLGNLAERFEERAGHADIGDLEDAPRAREVGGAERGPAAAPRNLVRPRRAALRLRGRRQGGGDEAEELLAEDRARARGGRDRKSVA